MGRSSRGRGRMKRSASITSRTRPEHAQAAAMFALKRRAGTPNARLDVRTFEMRTHTMLVAPTDGRF